jgi:hypothetical protein
VDGREFAGDDKVDDAGEWDEWWLKWATDCAVGALAGGRGLARAVGIPVMLPSRGVAKVLLDPDPLCAKAIPSEEADTNEGDEFCPSGASVQMSCELEPVAPFPLAALLPTS